MSQNKSEKSENRFKKIHSESENLVEGNEIWVDTVTGVNYLYHSSGFSAGLTPLLDDNGKPVITK